MFLILFSLALSLVDSYSRLLVPIRSGLSIIINPIFFLAESPYILGKGFVEFFEPRESLQQQNLELKKRNLKLQQMVIHYQSLEEENQRIRSLLGIANRLPFDTKLAQVVGITPGNPSRVVVNKGSSDGLSRGQAVVGGPGILGLIAEVSVVSSRVMLISDHDSAVAVRVRRTGFRSILGGTGDLDLMLLENVPTSEEILVGDILETTGLGGIYPPGYALGEVISFVLEDTSAYAEVSVRPLLDLKVIQDVLVIIE